jgi:hypothetical protein
MHVADFQVKVEVDLSALQRKFVDTAIEDLRKRLRRVR